MRPFIKWAGGKRWLTSHPSFNIPKFSGRYIEPFLGGGAVFFHLKPERAILSDLNGRLIETYEAIKEEPRRVECQLKILQRSHSPEFYYEERSRMRRRRHTRAAQFLYLNRTCWNGLYRENKAGIFNVPIGTKSRVVYEDEDLMEISSTLKYATLMTGDFESVIDEAEFDDLVFVDPPYTTAHNVNGFLKYNQNIFSWSDQVRLKFAVGRALQRGAKIVLTNADHASVHELYADLAVHKSISRASVIAGKADCRGNTTEALYVLGS